MKKFIKTALFVSVFVLLLSSAVSAETCVSARIQCSESQSENVLVCGNSTRELLKEASEAADDICSEN